MLESLEYKNKVAAVFMTAVFMQLMDTTIINVALPTLADEFQVDATAMDWTVLAFTLALAVMTPAAGWFGDRFGLRETFLVCLAGFVTASVLCGAAQSLDQLIIARTIKGAFSGMILPVGAALLLGSFPLPERSDAARKVITVVVVAPALGPIVGGLILEVTSWRWIFLSNVPIGLVALVLAFRWLEPGVGDKTDAGPFDIIGFALSTAGLAMLVYSLARGGELGWGSSHILTTFGLSVVALAALIPFELRSTHPLLSLRLLSSRLFGMINLLAIPVYGAFMALVYLLPLFLQKEAGLTPLQVGVAIASQPIGVLAMTQVTGKYLYKQIGPRRLILVGSAVGLLTGLAAWRFDTSTTVWMVAMVMFVRGAGMGLIFVPVQTAVYAEIRPSELGRATALFTTIRQLAPAIGVAVAASVLSAGFARDPDDVATRVDSYQQAILLTSLLFVLGGLLALFIKDEDAASTMAETRGPLAD